MRLPTYAQHRRFCEVDGWQDKDARANKKQGDHHRYIKQLPDGDVLFTEISHGAGQYQSKSFWRHILRDQLKVNEDDFWAAVEKGIVPVRQREETPKPEGESKPLWLVQNLQRLVELPLDEIAGMTLKQALNVWDAWQSSPDGWEDLI